MKKTEIIKILKEHNVYLKDDITYKEVLKVHKEWYDWKETNEMIEKGKDYFAQIESGIPEITYKEWCQRKYIRSILEFIPTISNKKNLSKSEISKTFRLYNLYNNTDYNDDFNFVYDELLKIYKKNN